MKVCIVRLSSLGDVAIASPLSRYLFEMCGVRPDFVCENRFCDVLSGDKYIENLIIVDVKKARSSFGNFAKEVKRLVSVCKGKKYDVVIDVQGTVKSMLVSKIIAFCTGCKVHGFSFFSVRDKIAGLFYNKTTKIPLGENIIKRNFTIVRDAIGLKQVDDVSKYLEKSLKFTEYSFDFLTSLSDNSDVFASLDGKTLNNKILNDKALNNNVLNDKVIQQKTIHNDDSNNKTLHKRKKNIAIIVGSSKATKNYPIESYVKVINELINDCNIFLTYGSIDEKATAGIISLKTGCFVIPSVMSIDRLKSFIASVDLVIGSDTGPTHIARFIGTPNIALFITTDSKRNFFPDFNARHVCFQIDLTSKNFMEQSVVVESRRILGL